MGVSQDGPRWLTGGEDGRDNVKMCYSFDWSEGRERVLGIHYLFVRGDGPTRREIPLEPSELMNIIRLAPETQFRAEAMVVLALQTEAKKQQARIDELEAKVKSLEGKDGSQ